MQRLASLAALVALHALALATGSVDAACITSLGNTLRLNCDSSAPRTSNRLLASVRSLLVSFAEGQFSNQVPNSCSSRRSLTANEKAAFACYMPTAVLDQVTVWDGCRSLAEYRVCGPFGIGCITISFAGGILAQTYNTNIFLMASRGPQSVMQDFSTIAHELMHVMQYQALGTDTFMDKYVRDVIELPNMDTTVGSIELEAYAWEAYFAPPSRRCAGSVSKICLMLPQDGPTGVPRELVISANNPYSINFRSCSDADVWTYDPNTKCLSTPSGKFLTVWGYDSAARALINDENVVGALELSPSCDVTWDAQNYLITQFGGYRWVLRALDTSKAVPGYKFTTGLAIYFNKCSATACVRGIALNAYYGSRLSRLTLVSSSARCGLCLVDTVVALSQGDALVKSAGDTAGASFSSSLNCGGVPRPDCLNAPQFCDPSECAVTTSPTLFPTPFPTRFPTPFPTRFPTPFPTRFPTQWPSKEPTLAPSASPSVSPTQSPTPMPTKKKKGRKPKHGKGR